MLTYCGGCCSDFDIEEVLAAGKKKTEELKEQLKLMAGSFMAGTPAFIQPLYSINTAFIPPSYSLNRALIEP